MTAVTLTGEQGINWFDSHQYPIKAKIHIQYKYFVKHKKKFIDSLDLREFSDEERKTIESTLEFNYIYKKYQGGFFGPSDHQSIVFIEEDDKNQLLISIYNNEKYILRDYSEIKEKLKNSFFFCKFTFQFFKWYPAKIKYFFYINNVELNEKSPKLWLKGNFLRYLILFATPVVTIYWNKVLNTPLKEIDFSTAGFLFWIYVIIFMIEYFIMNQREEFLLELKD